MAIVSISWQENNHMVRRDFESTDEGAKKIARMLEISSQTGKPLKMEVEDGEERNL